MAAGGRPIRLAVNVSRLGIFQEDFVDYYTNMKNQYQIPDGLLELEFTESLAIEDNSLLRQRIDELTARGLDVYKRQRHPFGEFQCVSKGF